ncbi:HAD-IIIC family phosphatase [Streptomyces anulatus]|uniref:HAD-IIIC family phosphatase n=1 Tax=Streptomyces anulatus TaxID=1892 RepID=UPI00224EA52D|nr:HAD-IIIC family phosphatase [Streptomyces anulatus]MCX4486866.1 HAD-IIIC family phosphatase [Streptomyces anulatus]MCX4523023.1 HAD-IIIC family phosphatase [Streptomyces anulatus]MCX4606034.1 HAD-IIIC family phosphatase [Streptomyces anulatus]
MAKCVVWDLDDTLWRGTLSAGDDVVLEPRVLETIRTLDERGILQSIASKNNHDDAFRKLGELGIAEYFLYPQINWNSKSSSITELQTKLNIGLDTFVFVDDQEFERDEVAFVHPDVETVDAADLLLLPSLPRLSPAHVTEDARRRRLMYQQDEQRDRSELAFQGPRDEFLGSLAMVLTISRAGGDDLLRLEELTHRTSQLNSTGIHYSYDELEKLIPDPDHDLWVCELSDRYGSYGKIGMALVEKSGDRWTIALLLMSCRTVSKGVGTVLLQFLVKEAAARRVRLFARFRRTDRNRQMLLTYRLANFHVVSKDGADHLFENDLAIVRDYPDHVKVDIDA